MTTNQNNTRVTFRVRVMVRVRIGLRVKVRVSVGVAVHSVLCYVNAASHRKGYGGYG